MTLTSDYEIYDMLNRMARAVDFLNNKNEIKELLDKVTIVQQYLERYGSVGELLKHVKEVEDMAYVCKDMMTFDEAAKYLGVSKSHVYRLSSRNVLTKHRTSGKLTYFKKKDLDDFMMQNEILSDDELKRRSQAKAEEYKNEIKNKKLRRNEQK